MPGIITIITKTLNAYGAGTKVNWIVSHILGLYSGGGVRLRVVNLTLYALVCTACACGYPPRSEPPAQLGSRRHASTLRDLDYRVVFSKTLDRKLAMHLVPTLSSLCVIALCPRVPDRPQDAFSATNKRSKFASLAHDSTTERIAVAVENSLGIIAICALLSRKVSNQAKLDMACAIRLAKEINGLSNLAFPKDSARRLRCASTAFQTLQALWSNAL